MSHICSIGIINPIHWIVVSSQEKQVATSACPLGYTIWMNVTVLDAVSWYCSHTVDGRNPAPVDRWFIPLFIRFQHVSTNQGGARFLPPTVPCRQVLHILLASSFPCALGMTGQLFWFAIPWMYSGRLGYAGLCWANLKCHRNRRSGDMGQMWSKNKVQKDIVDCYLLVASQVPSHL